MYLKKSEIVVIKIGSSLLIDEAISETSLRYATSSNISLVIYFSTPILLFTFFYILTYLRINNV